MASEPVDVSFVVPTHDRPEFLAEAIASIVAQTRPAREIIVVDNGTNPLTAPTLAPFGERVQLIRSEPGSVQIARNTGFAAATSTWVATLDDDDILHPTYLEAAEPLMVDPAIDIVSCDHRKFRGDVFEYKTNFEYAPPGYWERVPREPRGGDRVFVGRFPLANLLQRIPVYPSTTIIRRDFALRIGGYDARMRGTSAEDIEFLVRALTHGNLGLVMRPLLDYRLHGSNDSASYVGQIVGRWRIFEFVRRNHPGLPPEFVAALDADLPERRLDLYKIAFRTGDRALMAEMAPLLRPSDWTPALHARRLIARAPRALAKHLRFGASEA